MKIRKTLLLAAAVSAAGFSAANADTISDYRLSTGTETVSAGETQIYGNSATWGAYCRAAGLAIGYDSDEYNATLNAFLTDTEDGISYYTAFDYVFGVSGSATFVNNGEIIFDVTEPTLSSSLANSEISAENAVVLSGSATLRNNGEISVSGAAVYIYASDSSAIYNAGEISGVSVVLDGATFANQSGAELEIDGVLVLDDYAAFTNAGTLEAAFIGVYEDSSFTNSAAGTIESAAEIVLEGAAEFTNRGSIESASVAFDIEESGASEFVNYGTISQVSAISWIFDLDESSDSISSSAAGTFENRGTIASDVGLSLSGSLVSKTQFTRWSGSGKVEFVNYGTISGDVSAESFVEVTLVQGSSIGGNLTLGEESTLTLVSGSSATDYTVVADDSVLNIVLTSGADASALIAGNLVLNTATTLSVSAESGVGESVSVQLYDGALVSDGSGSLSATSGTFTVSGTTYSWTLDTSTGTLTAAVASSSGDSGSSGTGSSEIIIDETNTDYALGKSTGRFDTALGAYVGTISGSSKLYSSANLEFSGSLAAFTGTTYITAGTFTATAAAALGSGEIAVSSGATLELDFENSSKTIANKTSGAGTILISSGTASFSKNVGTKYLTVAEGATLSGSVYFSQEDAVLTVAGTISLDAAAGETISGDDDLVVKIASTATLDLENGASVLESGKSVTIFGGNDDTEIYSATAGTALNDVVKSFIASDSTLAALATETAIIFTIDDDSGLVLTTASALVAAQSGGVHDGLEVLYTALVGDALDDATDGVTGIYSRSEYAQAASAAAAGTDSAIVSALISGNAGTVVETLSPLSYAAMFAVPVAAFQNDVRSVLSRLDLRRFENFDPEKNWELYAQVQYLSAENDDADDAPTFDYDLLGVLVGADYRVSKTLIFGAALAAGTGDADVHHGGGKIEITDYRLTAYASKMLADKVAFDFGAQFGLGDYEIKRKTAYGNVNGDTDGWSVGIFGNLGTQLAISKENKIYAEPYIGVTFMYAEVSGFSESGSGGMFDVDDFDGTSFTAGVGCNFAWEFELAGTRSRLGFGIAYTHDFMGDEVDIDASLGGAVYGISAAALPEDRFSFGPRLDVGLTETLGVFANYTFDIGTDSSSAHSANIGLRASF